MDGLLIIDKPVGPSSHDVVARVRRVLRESRIGHTGTLDPDASGVLPLVIGRATRLARFLSSSDKSYDAVVRLGFSTNTYDAAGQPTGSVHSGPLPSSAQVTAALDAFRGTFLQKPPAYSAKKVGGRPSYKTARRADRTQTESGGPASAAVDLAPVSVSTSHIEIVAFEGDRLGLRITCSAGFYVRALAHDLGHQLGTGAHLAALRRTRAGNARIEDAVPLAAIEDGAAGRERAEAALLPVGGMLPHLPALTLTELGVRHAGHGKDLSPVDFSGPAAALAVPRAPANYEVVRLLSAGGELVGLAEPAKVPGFLHPFVVLV